MAKDVNDVKTLEINLSVTPEQARTLANAIDLQIKSHERAARAQLAAGRAAIGDTLMAEARSLAKLKDTLLTR